MTKCLVVAGRPVRAEQLVRAERLIITERLVTAERVVTAKRLAKLRTHSNAKRQHNNDGNNERTAVILRRLWFGQPIRPFAKGFHAKHLAAGLQQHIL